MSGPFGLTTSGFSPMRLADVFDQLADDLRGEWGQNIRTDDRSVIGQLLGVIAERLGDLWAEGENVYASAYLDGATGSALDDLVALAALTRRLAAYSVVELTLAGDEATVITVDSVIRDEETLERWVILEEATITGGTATTTARPERTGPVVALAGTSWEIVTPISGWDTATNALDAELGRDVESDASLRERFGLTMRAGGGSSFEAIRAALLRLDDVTEAVVIENETIVEDEDGRPPKSFECVVRGGDDQEIVDSIWFGKPAGIETYGSETGTAVDSAGDSHEINWSRPTTRDIWMVVEYEPQPGFEEDGEDQILEAILDYASTFTIGKDVVPFEFVQHIEVPNILTLIIRVGFVADPPDDEPLEIARTELADFDSSRIEMLRLT